MYNEKAYRFIRKKKIDQKMVEECPFAHNKMETMYHPFV